MITKYNGYKAERATVRENLPAGGYVARIKSAEVINYKWGDVLNIMFDIAEGDFKGFFGKDYAANTRDDKKWRGTLRLNIPVEGDKYFETSKRIFNNFIACIEETNKGYSFDFEERSLAGKGIGVLFRNEEWEYDGKTGWTTRCCSVCTANEVRNGEFKMPKDKPLKKSAAQETATFTEYAEDDSELPF